MCRPALHHVLAMLNAETPCSRRRRYHPVLFSLCQTRNCRFTSSNAETSTTGRSRMLNKLAPAIEGCTPGPGIEDKYTRRRGRPPGHRHPMTNQGSHLAFNAKHQQASSARSAEQVRHVVSVALDFPRILVSSSATLFIRVPDPQAIASNSADPPRPSTRAPAGAASTKPVRQADRAHGPSREAHLRAHSPLRARSRSSA